MNRITLSTSHLRQIGSALLCVGITAFLYWVNISTSKSTHSIGESQISYAIQNAFASSHHLTLAEHFKNIHDGANTDREIALAKDLLSLQKGSVLGVSSTLQETLNAWQQEPIALRQSLEYWMNVIEKHPDFRDAYIQASYIESRLGNTKKSLELLELAKRLDPSL